MQIHKLLLIVLSIFLLAAGQAQNLLSPEDAVKLSLQQNYAIQIAANEAEIAAINDNSAAAGMLPKLSVSAGDNFSYNNVYQELSSGAITNKTGVPVNNANASIMLSWTIFDGMKMFASQSKLNALNLQSQAELKSSIQNTTAQVLNTYYQTVLQKQQLKATRQMVELYQERVLLTEKKFQVGYNDKAPYLQAQVDLASQKVTLIRLESLYKQFKANLNLLLGREASIDFDVVDEFALETLPEWSALADSTVNNVQAQSAELGLEAAKFQVKELAALQFPVLSTFGGYLFSRNNSKAGFIMTNQSYGPQLGLSASFPIFGYGYRKQVEAGKLRVLNQELFVKQIQNENNVKLFNAIQNYEAGQASVVLSRENVVTARENLDLTLAKFKLNQATSIDLKTAQMSYEQALYDNNLIQYNTKIAEIELKRLSNLLIKDQ